MRAPQPDFLLLGAPKAGTTALHAALTTHPEVFMTSPKEPKYWMCDNNPPPHWSGPGDRHSQQEWIWRPREYSRLFEPAGPEQMRGESTPFYLWSKPAHRRIAESLPGVRLIAVVRDPIDRAYSNWMHLWCDGLEPVSDFEAAFDRQDERIRNGWAPFWRYRDLGMYGEQLAHLYDYVDPERVLVLRYREIVESPRETLDRTCRFLGIAEGVLETVPRDNSRDYVAPGWRPTVLGPAIRAGARLGQFAPPRVWREASKPLTARLLAKHAGTRPALVPDQRARLVPVFAEDVKLLSSLTGQDFSAWFSVEDRGSFQQRVRDVRETA